jgi:elongation factor 1-beta
MGQIAATYDLMPESTEIDLDAVIVKLPSVLPAGVKLLETKILPVAFGLMKVNAGFLIDDADDSVGGNLEDALHSIEGIENVECVSNTVV